MKKKLLSLALVIMMLLSIAPMSFAAGITITGKVVINVGETTQWKATGAPTDANPWVSWSSGNPDVATVDANGNIKGLKEGQSNITVTTASGVKKNVLITVIAEPAKSIAFVGKTSIKVGETTTWGVVPTPANASKKVTWASGNPGVATVDANGNIKALKSGQSNITATTPNGIKKTVLITVTADPATAVNLAGATSVMEGKTIQWKVTVAPTTANQIVTWTSGNPAVATVNVNGYIVAKKPGQANITATTANGIKKTVLLTVTSNKPTSVTLAGRTSVYPGNKVKWTAKVYPSGANQYVTWSSGNPSVATVDAEGNITAKKAGKANITATAVNGVKKTVLITVNAMDYTSYAKADVAYYKRNMKYPSSFKLTYVSASRLYNPIDNNEIVATYVVCSALNSYGARKVSGYLTIHDLKTGTVIYDATEYYNKLSDSVSIYDYETKNKYLDYSTKMITLAIDANSWPRINVQ